MHFGAQPAGGQAEQTTAGPDVQEGAATQIFGFQIVLQRVDGAAYPVFIQQPKKLAPVLAELEPLAALYFYGMSTQAEPPGCGPISDPAFHGVRDLLV